LDGDLVHDRGQIHRRDLRSGPDDFVLMIFASHAGSIAARVPRWFFAKIKNSGSVK
jgi:hypothetical protein